MILFLAGWFLHERITPSFIALSLVAVGGVAVILYDPGASTGQVIGVALTLAGIVCCAAYSVITRRWIPGARETSQVILAQQAHALVFALVLVVVVGVAGGVISPSSLTLLGVVSAVGSGASITPAPTGSGRARATCPLPYAALSFYLIPIGGPPAPPLASDWIRANGSVRSSSLPPSCHHSPARRRIGARPGKPLTQPASVIARPGWSRNGGRWPGCSRTAGHPAA
jgi:hypothetical protein